VYGIDLPPDTLLNNQGRTGLGKNIYLPHFKITKHTLTVACTELFHPGALQLRE